MVHAQKDEEENGLIVFWKHLIKSYFRIVISKDTLYEHNNTTRTGKIRMVVRFSPHLTVYNDSFTNKWCGDLLLFNKEGWKWRTPFFILLFIDIFKRRKINTNSSDYTRDVHIDIKNVIFCKKNKTWNFPPFYLQVTFLLFSYLKTNPKCYVLPLI